MLAVEWRPLSKDELERKLDILSGASCSWKVHETWNHCYRMACGLTIASELLSVITPKNIGLLGDAHNRHHLEGHAPHGQEWPLWTERRDDGTIDVYCP